VADPFALKHVMILINDQRRKKQETDRKKIWKEVEEEIM